MISHVRSYYAIAFPSAGSRCPFLRCVKAWSRIGANILANSRENMNPPLKTEKVLITDVLIAIITAYMI